MPAMQALDGEILLFIQDHLRTDLFSNFFIPYTNFGEAGVIWILIGVVLLFFVRTRKVGWMMLLSLLLCYLFNDHVLKVLVQRPRPFVTWTELEPLIAHPNSYSFPSGHACSSFAAATTCWRGLKGKGLDWFRWLMMVLAALMAFSRLYVGVHYPTDVLCGLLVGVLGSSLIWYSLQRRYDQIEAAVLRKRAKG